MLRDQVFVLDHMYMSVFSTAGWILRLVVTMALLVSVHPALALLAVFAIPTVATSTWRPAVERTAQERAAPFNRLARHLFTTATTAAAGKEVRVTGIGDRLVCDRRHAWQYGHDPIAAARWGLDDVALARVGDLRRRVRRIDRVRLRRTARVGRRGVARARRRCATVGVHRRDGRRDRFLARLLGVRRAAARVARGLRGVARRGGGPPGATTSRARHSLRPRLVRVSRRRASSRSTT